MSNNKFKILCILFLMIFKANSQVNYIEKWFEHKKVENKPENVPYFKLFNPSKRNHIKKNDSQLYLDLNQKLFNEIIINKPSSFILNLNDQNGNNLDIELFESDIFSDNAEMLSSSGRKIEIIGKSLHYWGKVKGVKSWAVFSIVNDELFGSYKVMGKKEVSISKIKSFNYLLETDLYDNEPLNCATKDDLEIESYVKKEILLNRSSVTTNKCINIYVEVSEDVMNRPFFGTVASVANYMSFLFNYTALVYANEEITIKLSGLLIWDTVSPYDVNSSSTGPYHYLGLFQNNRTSFNGDFAMLFSFNAANPGNGIAATTNSICSTNSAIRMGWTWLRNFIPDDVNGTITLDFKRTASVFSHELGHLLGSPHTHSCFWNGDGTSLDKCFGTSCLPNVITHQDPELSIMSYCAIDPEDYFIRGFGTQPGNLIRNYISNANCYDSCDEVCLPELYIYRLMESDFEDYIGTFKAETIYADNTIRNDANVEYKASDYVYLSDGFNVDDTSVFNAVIEPCNAVTASKPTTNKIQVDNKLSKEEDFLNIHPIPTKDFIEVSYIDNLDKIELYSLTGNKILEETNLNKKQVLFKLPNSINSGIYILKVLTKSGLVLNKKIIKD